MILEAEQEGLLGGGSDSKVFDKKLLTTLPRLPVATPCDYISSGGIQFDHSVTEAAGLCR